MRQSAEPDAVIASEPWSATQLLGRFGVFILLVWISRFFLVTPLTALGFDNHFLHGVNLIFHEAGHFLLIWAPRILMVLGGSLAQVIIPLALMIAFLARNRDGFAAAVCLWWLGQNLVDIAPYINDARMLQLPLLGGGTGAEIEGHDWEYILTYFDALKLDFRIARIVWRSGQAIMIAALLGALGLLLHQAWKRWQNARLNPQ